MIGRTKRKVRRRKYAVGEGIEGAKKRPLMLSMRVWLDFGVRIEPRVARGENTPKLDVRPALRDARALVFAGMTDDSA